MSPGTLLDEGTYEADLCRSSIELCGGADPNPAQRRRQSSVKIATYNANSIRMRSGLVVDWLKRHAPDVLCVQETKVQDEHFPHAAFDGLGYH
ncbi:MAG TPA: endonuclease/exonuclease/phosphatase family protein, partial [Elusimicrobiota bacterium]|nr:endonuclease/exonuclease/phosphatase family protein [Elusimicrobiota bacterium]